MVEQVAAAAGAGIELAHGWTLHAVEPVTPAEAEATLRQPVAAIPLKAAACLGLLRIFAVPYLECGGEKEFVSTEPPAAERHSSLWLERPDGFDLFVSFYEASAHDTGFELLAAVADLLVPRMSERELASYGRLLRREAREGATGEMDEDALEARESEHPAYAAISLAATLAEYLHALWHDVEVRQGPEHLAAKFLRRRFEFLARIFPPDPGQVLFY